jgi:hypothetical protein
MSPAQAAGLQLVVVGDIHAQATKFWQIMQAAGMTDAPGRPSERALQQQDLQVILLGDLVHAKSRERYSELTGITSYDEYNPEHLRAAEAAQESFLREVRDFQQLLPAGRLVILMGNHDFNAITDSQGPLRTDDVTHLEWKEGAAGLPADLREWIRSWPVETVVHGLHFAHVGPLPEHNTFAQAFYLENRRRWLQQDRDLLAGTPYRLGVYGHTPMRGGLSVASQGRALLIDNNGVRDEYSFMLIDVLPDSYRIRLQGLYFDEIYSR